MKAGSILEVPKGHCQGNIAIVYTQKKDQKDVFLGVDFACGECYVGITSGGKSELCQFEEGRRGSFLAKKVYDLLCLAIE